MTSLGTPVAITARLPSLASRTVGSSAGPLAVSVRRPRSRGLPG